MKIKGFPICDICKKPVDFIQKEIDSMTGDLIFTAFCHGKKDKSILHLETIRDAKNIELTVAFHGQKQLNA